MCGWKRTLFSLHSIEENVRIFSSINVDFYGFTAFIPLLNTTFCSIATETPLIKHKGKKPIMLYFGDFDPSGIEMLDAMKLTLKDEMNVNNIEYKRIALVKDDIFTYKLPHTRTHLKSQTQGQTSTLTLMVSLRLSLTLYVLIYWNRRSKML